MCVYEGPVLLATLDPVRIEKDGTELHISDFVPTQVVLEEERQIGRWMFFEICVFVAEHFPQIQAIGFAFARPTGSQGSAAGRGASRAQLLQGIGAVNVKIEPLTSGAHVVSGIWPYNERNIAAVRAALEEQRLLFRDHPIARSAKPAPWPVTLLRSLMQGRKDE